VRKLHRKKLIILLIIAWLVIPSTAMAQSFGDSVVRAILFYSPTCPHCHKVITEVLIPMVDDYGGDRLQIIGIDISQPGGGQVYQAAIDQYEIPPQRQGVPTLVVGDTVLVGDIEIPEVFPGLVEEGLDADGIDWPDIPGLEQVIPPQVQEEPSPTLEPQATASPAPTATTEPTNTSTPTASALPTQTPIPTPASTPPALALTGEELSLAETQAPPPDPVGFTLASLVLLGMVVAAGYVAWRVMIARQRLFQPVHHSGVLDPGPATSLQTWAISILALLGLGVATYLAYVEITHVEAICGPVGECNIVQSSPYARIVGIPVAVLGMLNYVAIGVLWTGQKSPGDRWADLSALGLVGLTVFGTLFSIYLTCLELFVIRAVCAWCLSSAVITTLLLLLVMIPITHKES
jgi:uncharacterized membrane protein